MSADQTYFIKFAVPPSKKRIGEMIFAIIDALGAGAFFLPDEQLAERNILMPYQANRDRTMQELQYGWEDEKIETAVFYGIHPATPAHSEGSERGSFFTHYWLQRYFLKQPDIIATYQTYDSDSIGKQISLVDAENLMDNFLSRGYFSMKDHDFFPLPANPTHPDCPCGKPLRHCSSVTEWLNFTCVANGCRKRPVRLYGEDAKALIESGVLPSAYKLHDDNGCMVYVPDHDARTEQQTTN